MTTYPYINVHSGATPSPPPPPPYPQEWVRNPDWIPLPEPDPLKNEAYFLYAVIDGNENFIDFSFGSNQVVDVDWGDGTQTNELTSANYNYDYAVTPGTVYQFDNGINYKQVIIYLDYDTPLSGLRLWFSTVGTSQNILDVKISLPDANQTINGGILTRGSVKPFMERIKVVSIPSPCLVSVGTLGGLNGLCYALKAYEVDYSKIDFTGADIFTNTKIINVGDFTNHYLTSAQRMIGNGHIPSPTRIGNVTMNNSTNAIRMLNGSVEYCGNITMPLCTTVQHLCNGNISLKEIGVIDMPLLTDMRTMCLTAKSLIGIEFTDCSNVTLVDASMFGTNAGTAPSSLSYCRMPGLTLGFNIRFTNMGTAALDEMFTLVGTASGTQTIDARNNPGSATCDPTIATAKGYTVLV